MNQVKTYLGVTAILSGVLGVIIAFSFNAGGLLLEKESVTLKDKGISILKEKIGIESQEKKNQLKIENPTVFGFSLVAILTSTIGLFTKSHHSKEKPSGLLSYFHLNGAGLALGLTGLLWSYVLLAIIVAVVIVVIGAVGSSLGL